MNLSTGQSLTRNMVHTIPLPVAGKKRVEEITLQQGLSTTKYYKKKSIQLANIEDTSDMGTQMPTITICKINIAFQCNINTPN